ncbi:MAG: flagellar basal-body rod protein FlgG [Rhodospirillales bacterium]|nr:flagellar basal-body rod protein FlgG [Rhodospirillales bacterium]USO08107.1 MAG: flagellar basal-body rod protein FlgG [Rhodospirillales bacterium]
MLSLDIAATGMLAQQMNVDVISNNIANMTTTGFKRQRAEFQDLIYQNKATPGVTSSSTGSVLPSGIQLGLGVKPGSVYRINEQGTISMTGNTYDIAIAGRGWFQINMPDGSIGYTRDGTFAINADGQLVNPQGYTVEPNITIPADAHSVNISDDGVVTVNIAGQTTTTQVGQLQLATFQNDAGLEAVGNNILLETAASGSPTVGNPTDVGFGKLQQGAKESSNVNVVDEITSMITAQRSYEMNSKVVQTSDDMLGTLTQLR